jgi:hypothetical protein
MEERPAASRHQAAHSSLLAPDAAPELPQLTAHVTGGRASGRQCIRVRLTRLHLVAMHRSREGRSVYWGCAAWPACGQSGP